MQLSKDTSAGRALTAIVVAAVMALVAGALLMGVLTAREISAVVTEQFNAQQMVIAQALRARIERELNEVRHEIRVTTRLLGADAHAPVAELLRQNLARTEGLSASQAELVDRAAGRAIACTPAGACADQAVPGRDPVRAAAVPARRKPAHLGVGRAGRGGRGRAAPGGRGRPGRRPRGRRHAEPHHPAARADAQHHLRQNRLRLGDRRPGHLPLPPQPGLRRPQRLHHPRGAFPRCARPADQLHPAGEDAAGRAGDRVVLRRLAPRDGRAEPQAHRLLPGAGRERPPDAVVGRRGGARIRGRGRAAQRLGPASGSWSGS